jgi:hypothetical protein
MFLKLKSLTLYLLIACLAFVSCNSNIVIDEQSLVSPLSGDLVDDANDSNGFGGGTHYGTKYSNDALTLDLDQNRSKHSSDWTPHFSELVAYWSLDNNYTDFVGSNDGVATGATFSDNAKLGSNSSGFDGSDYIRFDSSPELQMGENSFSISVWIYPQSVLSSQRIINNRGTGAGGAPAGYQLGVDTAGSGLWRINNTALVDQATNISSCSSCGSAYPLNSWYHIVFSYEADTVVNVYVNGELDYTRPTGSLGSITNTLPTAIGASIADAGIEGTTGQFFDGLIDEVAIWNNAFLSATEAKNIYKKQKVRATGEFQSRVMSSLKGLLSWSSLKAETTIPFLKELPGDDNGDLIADIESTSEYSGSLGSVSSGLRGLWKFSEASWNDAVDDVIDSTGNNRHMRTSGGVSNSDSYIGKAAQLDGSDDLLRINPYDNTIVDTFSLSFWAKPGKTIDLTTERTSGVYGVTGENYALYPQNSNYILPTNSHAGMGVSVGTNGIGVFEHTGGYLPALLFYPVSITDWVHITVVYNNKQPSLYVNGKFIKTGLTSTKIVHLSVTYIGASPYGKYLGSLDELAIWDRSLSPAEIVELYRRGGNRIKYQVRSCPSVNCSGESWIGPDGTDSSFFSELENRKIADVYDANGIVTTDGLEIVFNNHTSVLPNPFFQYRMILESNDSNSLCLGKPCLPEVKSISISQ